MKFTEKSIEIAEYTLKNVDIYLIDDFSYKLLAHDVGSSHRNLLEEIRTRWLYSSSGFFNSINKYNSFLKRVNEFLVNLDYPKSLRQRLNIVHEMLETDFNSLVPVHTSIALKEDRKQVLDANEAATGSNFSWIIHPGQTRAQASVFCKRNLNKVLLYISKQESNNIVLKNFKKIYKIDSLEKLYKIYQPLQESNATEHRVQFEFGKNEKDVVNNQKIDRHNNIHIPILKAIRIFIRNINNKNFILNNHPSTKYVGKSFFSFDKFCDIFHNNQLKIYSFKKQEFLKTIFNKINNNLLKVNINQLDCPIKKFLDILDIDEQTVTPKSTILRGLIPFYKDEKYKLFFEKYEDFFNDHLLEFEKEINHTNTLINLPVETVSPDTNFKNIAEKNGFKGFALFLGDLEYDKFIRSPIELLFFISAFNTITVSGDNQLAIINCEHEYWKTGENYKEWKLTKEMYSE